MYRKNARGETLGLVLYITIWVIVGLLLISGFVIWPLARFSNRITDETALPRFQTITGSQDVKIVRETNNFPFFGDPNDVIYELLVNGKPVGGRCTNGPFSPIVCRVYQAGGD